MAGSELDGAIRGIAVLTPKRSQNFDSENNIEMPESPPLKDPSMFPWNWGESAGKIEALSPSPDGGRRGRPRADIITSLIIEGSTSPSAIKCMFCNRVFPREKSLQAHMRTHTGERPYTCDFPGCSKAFAQSGQLKTHQRLHTGEKPFVCTAPGCKSRFTHANRHCPDHPYYTLRRVNANEEQPNCHDVENSEEVLQWLKKYKRQRDEKPNIKLRDRKIVRELDMQLDQVSCKKQKLDPFCYEEPREMIGALALMQLARSVDLQPLNLSNHE